MSGIQRPPSGTSRSWITLFAAPRRTLRKQLSMVGLAGPQREGGGDLELPHWCVHYGWYREAKFLAENVDQRTEAAFCTLKTSTAV